MGVACLSTNGANHFSVRRPINTLYVATTNGVAIVERDATGAWRCTGEALAGSHVSGMAVQESTGRLFAACMPGSLMESSDGGRTWTDIMPGMSEEGAYSVRCYEESGRVRLYVGTQPVGLFRSDDGGKSWTDLAAIRTAPMHEKWRFPAPGHLPHLKTLTVDPRNGDIIYAGVEQGALLKSTDGGASWEDLDEFVDYESFVYKDIHQVLLRPTNPNEIYLTTGLGVFHSADEGAHWSQLTDSSFRIGYPDQLLFAPDNDQNLFVSGGFAIPYYWVEAKTAKGTVMLSQDGGKTWRPPSKGFPESCANVEAMTMVGFPGGFEIFAGTTDGEVYISADRGESWTSIIDGLAPVSKPTHDTLIAGIKYDNDLRPGGEK